MKTVGFIEVSPAKNEKVCGNCMYFYKWGVHSGLCSIKGIDKLDTQKCKKFTNNAD